MVRVTVRLFSTLAHFGPKSKGDFSLEVDSTGDVAQLLALLQIPAEVERVVLVNGRYQSDDQPLRDGDRVVIFPPMTGG